MAKTQTYFADAGSSETDLPAASAPEKRPYRPPRLTVHGTVADVTAELGVGAVDGLGGSIVDL